LNYEYLWKELEAMVIELRSKGKDVPKDAIENLKAAKTLMSIQRVDPSSTAGEDVEEYLRMTEAGLMSSIEYYFGRENAEQWLLRLVEARERGLHETYERQVGFVAGVPKGEDWVRIRITELVDAKELDSMVRGLGLSKRVEAEDTVLLHGPPEKVKAFMKQLTERVRRK